MLKDLDGVHQEKAIILMERYDIDIEDIFLLNQLISIGYCGYEVELSLFLSKEYMGERSPYFFKDKEKVTRQLSKLAEKNIIHSCFDINRDFLFITMARDVVGLTENKIMTYEEYIKSELFKGTFEHKK